VEDTCKQDNVGVPRCAGLTCVAAGGACASSANCCGGLPCVPNPVAGGTPPYVCSGSSCVAACSSCTDNADCCPGLSCVQSAGSTRGICGPCETTDGGTSSSGGSSGGSGGSSGGGSSGGGTSSGGSSGGGGSSGSTSSGGNGGSGGGGCALFGQLCTTGADCCNSVPCTSGRCQYPLQ
jgi:hypothetical protein